MIEIIIMLICVAAFNRSIEDFEPFLDWREKVFNGRLGNDFNNEDNSIFWKTIHKLLICPLCRSLWMWIILCLIFQLYWYIIMAPIAYYVTFWINNYFYKI